MIVFTILFNMSNIFYLLDNEYIEYKNENLKRRHIELKEHVYFESYNQVEKCYSKKLTFLISEVFCEKN